MRCGWGLGVVDGVREGKGAGVKVGATVLVGAMVWVGTIVGWGVAVADGGSADGVALVTRVAEGAG